MTLKGQLNRILSIVHVIEKKGLVANDNTYLKIHVYTLHAKFSSELVEGMNVRVGQLYK